MQVISTFEDVEIDEEIPNCEDQLETVCFAPPEGGEQICKEEFIKQVCTLETVTTAKTVRNTECKQWKHPGLFAGLSAARLSNQSLLVRIKQRW